MKLFLHSYEHIRRNLLAIWVLKLESFTVPLSDSKSQLARYMGIETLVYFRILRNHPRSQLARYMGIETNRSDARTFTATASQLARYMGIETG